MANAAEIRSALLSRLEEVLQKMYPQGQIKGHEFMVGDVGGSPGKSLKVNLNGKPGVWSDFAGGDKGSIIELWIKRYDYKSYKEAAPSLHEYLGLTMDQPSRSRKKYKKPTYESTKSNKPSVDYLLSRKISQMVIVESGVSHSPEKALMFPYRENFEDQPCFIKYLALERRDGEKHCWVSPESKPILYGMHTRLVRESRVLGICEGEIDALSWQTAGLPFVSVPFGAKEGSANDEWFDNCYDWLQQFETIYLSPDMDKAGQSALKDWLRRFEPWMPLVIELPKKDANEVLMEGGVSMLQACFNRAKPVNPDGIKTFDDFDGGKEIWQELRHGKRGSIGTPFVIYDEEKFPFKIRKHEGTFITGYNFSGKSNLLYQYIAQRAANQEVCFLGSYEEKAKSIMGIIAVHAMGRIFQPNEYHLFVQVKDLLQPYILIHDTTDFVTLEDFLSKAAYAIKRHGAKHIGLDSLTKLRGVSLTKNESVEEAVKRLSDFWQKYPIDLEVLCHPRKGMQVPGKSPRNRVPETDDIKGDGIIGDLATNILSIHRDEDDDVTLSLHKDKVAGNHKKVDLYFDALSKRLSLDNKPPEPYIKL